jgi:hypothetical protein
MTPAHLSTPTDAPCLSTPPTNPGDRPSATTKAVNFVVSVLVIFFIVVATVVFIVETIPTVARDDDAMYALSILEGVCIAMFTLEISVRMSSVPLEDGKYARGLKKWMKNPMNVVDIIAVIPWYLELIVGGGTGAFSVVRVVRLIRVFRVFKINRYNASADLFSRALQRSAQPLTLLFYFMLIANILFSSAIYYAENLGNEYNPSDETNDSIGGPAAPFDSIPRSMYWCAVTMTTVGYGDMFPITLYGRCATAPRHATPVRASLARRSILLEDWTSRAVCFRRVQSARSFCLYRARAASSSRLTDRAPPPRRVRFIAVLTLFAGIIVIAMPITLIGSNFVDEYRKSQMAQWREKKRLEALAKAKEEMKVLPLLTEMGLGSRSRSRSRYDLARKSTEMEGKKKEEGAGGGAGVGTEDVEVLPTAEFAALQPSPWDAPPRPGARLEARTPATGDDAARLARLVIERLDAMQDQIASLEETIVRMTIGVR